MGRDARVSELLGRWEELRDRGAEPTPEELCRSCPELTDAVGRMIAVLRAFDPLGQTLVHTLVSDGRPPDLTPRPALPAVPGYAVVREIGRGGMGVVYEAVQLGLNRHVALKMIRAGGHAGAVERERFRREAEAVARLQHPNIVQIFEVGEAGGLPFCALEYVPGGTLADRLRDGPLPATEAAATCRLLAGAIDAAHHAGVVHRDLKPANVLLNAECGVRIAESGQEGAGSGLHSAFRIPSSAFTPKVSDFGLAKLLDPPADGPARQETASGAVLGTPSYMSPEQARGEKAVGPAADVWALGAILYETLTGRVPFLAESPFATLEEVVHSEPVPPRRLNRSVPHDLETVCLKCLEKDPGRRYASAADLAADLGRFLDGKPVAARPVGPVSHAWRWCRRNPGVSASLAALVVVLVAATAVSASAAVRERNAAALANQRKAEADASYRRAREAVDELFVNVAEGKLKGVPGAQPVRKDLLRLALTYYQQFLAERADDPTNREEIAATYTKVAMVVGEVETAAAAAEWHEKAVAAWRSLVADSPDRSDYRKELAGALDLYGLHLARLSRLDDAVKAQGEAVSLIDGLLAADPDNLDYAGFLSRALTNLANAQGTLGRYADAIRTGERGIAVDETIARRQPDNLGVRRNMAAKWTNLGLDLHDLGRTDDAIRALETACRINGEVVAKWDALPEKPAKLADAIGNPHAGLVQSGLNLAPALFTDERLPEARRQYLAAAERGRALVAADPSARRYGELALSAESGAAGVGLSLDVPAAGLLAEAERACATGAKLSAGDPSNPTYRARLGNAHATRGAVLARLGKVREAHDAWAGAEGCFDPAPGKNATIREVHAGAWEMRALALLALKDAPGAAAATQTMLDISPTPDRALGHVFAARYFAGGAKLAPPADRAKYEDRAIASLRKGIEKGYKKFDRLRTDARPDPLRADLWLDPVRHRPEFRALLPEPPPKG